MTTDPKCKDRITDYLSGRISDLQAHKKALDAGLDDTPELGPVSDYGLAFDYVASGSFKDQREGYFRWQLSWGGPSDEFRFYVDGEKKCHRVEYWFLDWFDGAKRKLSGKREALLLYFFDWFDGMGAVDNAFNKGTHE
jgi:hypothetical protein